MLNLPWLSVGAVGFVSVHGHVVGDRLHEMIDAYLAGDVATALAIHRELLPVYTGMTRMQGTVSDQGGAGHARAARRPGPAAAGRRDHGRGGAAAHRPGGRRREAAGSAGRPQ